MTPSAQLKAKLLAEIEKAPSPTRSAVNSALVAAAVAAVAIVVAGFLALGAVHWHGRPEHYILFAASCWGVIALAATWSAFPPDSLIGRPRVIVLGLAVAAPIAAMLSMFALNVGYPETFAQCKGRPGFVCLDLTLTMGSVPVLALLLARRVGWAARPRLAGASIGIAMGAWTGVAITLSCECTNPSHVLLGHVLPMVLLALFGTFGAGRLAARNRLRAA